MENPAILIVVENEGKEGIQARISFEHWERVFTGLLPLFSLFFSPPSEQ